MKRTAKQKKIIADLANCLAETIQDWEVSLYPFIQTSYGSADESDERARLMYNVLKRRCQEVNKVIEAAREAMK